MLGRVLGIHDPADARAVIDRLIAERARETQVLDFKRDPPGGSDAVKRKYAERIAAMANGGGGLLVFGVAEKDSCADAPAPFELAGQEERLRQIATSYVHPYLRIHTHPVPVDDEGHGYLIVEIPPSPGYPHAVHKDNRLGYPRRDVSVTHFMTEAEIARAYVERRETDLARVSAADGLQREVESRLGASGVWMVCIPQDLHARVFVDMKAARDVVTQLMRERVALDTMCQPALGTEVRVRFRRLEMAHHWDDTTPQESGWTVLGDRGEFVCVRPGWDSRQLSNTGEFREGTPRHYVSPLALLKAAMSGLVGYRELAKAFGIAGEVLVRSGVLAKPSLLYWMHGGYGPQVLGETHDDAFVDSMVDVDDLMTGAGLGIAAKRVLSDIVTAFGQSEFPMLSTDGDVVEAYVPHDSRPYLRKWAQEYGVGVQPQTGG